MSVTAIKELRTFSRTLPAEHQAAVSFALRHDRYLRTFAELLNRLPNQPLNLAVDRRAHVLKVIANFHLFISGRFEELYSLLYDQEKTEATPRQYAARMREARSLFAEQSREERRETHLALVLHDIGYLKEEGWEHGVVGGQMAPEIIRKAGIPIDSEKVGLIIGNHSLTNNFGVDIFPEKLLAIPARVRRQIFILDCMDTTAKGKGLKSKLGIRLLGEMRDVLARPELLSNPDWFVEYRLRHLLGPNTFVWLREDQFTALKEALQRVLTPKELSVARRVLAENLENGAFPIFQELFLNHTGATETVILIRELALRVAELELSKGEKIFFKTEPDIFSLSWGGPERASAIGELKESLASRRFNRVQDLIVHYDPDGRKIISLALAL